jgi:DNA-binding Lrp family transcriptional regulator/DNA-binding transcriptional MerR regulator
MRMQEILAAVPGLEKRFVHYLEGQGYIRPRKLQKARIARRDYSEHDLERIRAIWRYYQRGISVQRAFELLTRVPADGAYVLFPAVGGRWAEALDLLKQQANVVEAAVVYGETADVIANVHAPHDSDIYAVLDSLFEIGIIAGLPLVLRYSAFSADAGRRRGGDVESSGEKDMATIRAWVLIKVPAKQIGGLVEELRSYPGIVEASAIYGETDVIAKIEVPDHAELDDLVVNRIQSIEAVESTRTFIGIGSLHWQRGG